MRYVKPDASKLVGKLDSFVRCGDGFLAFMTCAWSVFMAGFFGVGGLINGGNPLFLLSFIPWLLWEAAFFIRKRGTVELNGRNAYSYLRGLAAYEKLDGMDAEVGQPLLGTIWKHSVNSHPNGGLRGKGECMICEDRIRILNELVRDRAIDGNDIEYAKNYLEGRRSLA